MKNLFLLLFFVLLFISCQAQTSVFNLQWKEYEFKDSGMKVNFPCEPQRYFKSFQDEPRPIHVYTFDCEVEGIKFLISSKHYMFEFDETSYQKTFTAHKENFETMSDKIESLDEKKDFLTNDFNSRLYEIKYKSGGRLKNLVVVNEKRSYEAIIALTPSAKEKLKNSKNDFDEISKKFINSFQIIEK